MKKIIFAFILASGFIFSQNDSLKFRLYGESSMLATHKTFKYSLFENAEYGINNKLSITAHPIMIFISPSITLKYNFYNKEKITVSSLHGINYPTQLMNLIKNEGTGGFISPEFNIPQLFSIANSVIATLQLSENNFISSGLGIEFALNNSKLKPGTSVDMPLILARSMVYYKNVEFNFKVLSEGKLFKDLDYYLKSEIYLLPFNDNEYDYEYQLTDNNFFWEFSGIAFLNLTNTFKLGLGTKLLYGTYPFGTQWHLLPFIDFVKFCE